MHDKFMKTESITSNTSLYKKFHRDGFHDFDIMKETGYYAINGTTISYDSFLK